VLTGQSPQAHSHHQLAGTGFSRGAAGTRATPRFLDERGCLKLIFAILMESATNGNVFG
jgi:hypothetical protein